ncbi:hypothetical protein VCV18_002940 [Metarhizium anisopliae]
MQRAGRQVERPRVNQRKGAPPRRNHGQLREPHVVADGHGHGAVLGQVDQRDLVPGAQDVRLAKGDLAGDVDVEEVHFSVGAQQGAVRAEDQARVVVFFGVGAEFGNRPPDEVDLVVGGHGGQGVVGRGLLGGWRRREQGLCVVGEVLAPVGRVEALWENDNVGSSRGGVGDLRGGVF